MGKRSGIPNLARLRELVEDAPTVADSRIAIDMLARVLAAVCPLTLRHGPALEYGSVGYGIPTPKQSRG